MPELPEVEVVRRGLAAHLTSRTIAEVEVLHPRAVRRYVPGAGDFASRLVDGRIEAVHRRGKYLWLALSTGDALLGHLGMSGQLLVQPASAPAEKHLRIRFTLDDGVELRFVDQRTFGGFLVDSVHDEVPSSIVHIGRDPLDPLFDPDLAIAAVRRRRTELKRALLDQNLVSGIGNIYADEALWRSRLHGSRQTDRLTRKNVHGVLDAATTVMADALTAGGTSFDALYVNVNGESGYFSRALNVYGRDGEPCGRCGAPIRREAFMNRSSYYCPRCQRRSPRRG